MQMDFEGAVILNIVKHDADAHTYTRHNTGKAELLPKFTSQTCVKQHEVLIHFKTKSLFLVDE